MTPGRYLRKQVGESLTTASLSPAPLPTTTPPQYDRIERAALRVFVHEWRAVGGS